MDPWLEDLWPVEIGAVTWRRPQLRGSLIYPEWCPSWWQPLTLTEHIVWDYSTMVSGLIRAEPCPVCDAARAPHLAYTVPTSGLESPAGAADMPEPA